MAGILSFGSGCLAVIAGVMGWLLAESGLFPVMRGGFRAGTVAVLLPVVFLGFSGSFSGIGTLFASVRNSVFTSRFVLVTSRLMMINHSISDHSTVFKPRPKVRHS